MANNRFKLTRFTNPSGQQVWRLSGTLNGKRIRNNFLTREEAVEARQALEIKYLNEESEGQTVWTTLTHEQNRDAIAAINRLKHAQSGKTLSFAVDYLLQHYKEAQETMGIRESAKAYLDEKFRDHDRGIISRRQYESIETELKKLQSYFAGRVVGEIQAKELREYLDKPLGRSSKTPSLKTWNNRRGYLSTFFKFCLQEKYVAEDPILELPQYKIKKARGTAETLTADQAKEFMHWLEGYEGRIVQGKKKPWGSTGCMVPYFALTLFAGIRPDWVDGEIGKLRAQDIRFDTDVILIEPETSKINEKRIIKLQPNLRRWLEVYPIQEYPIIPQPFFQRMWADVRKHFKLPHDVMRHTYISMTVGAFRSVGDASLQAGNSESIIRKHYLDLKSTEEADAFWGIVPQGETLPVLAKKDGRYVATS